MTLGYENVNVAQIRGRLARPMRTVVGASVLLGAAVIGQLPYDVTIRYVEYVYYLVPPITACVGVLLLVTSLVAAPRRAWQPVLAWVSIVVAALSAILGVPGIGLGWSVRNQNYSAMGWLLAGSILHVLLGVAFWRTRCRVLPAQTFLLAILLPALTLAPFFGTSGFSASRYLPQQMIPSLGAPSQGRGLLSFVWEMFPDRLGIAARLLSSDARESPGDSLRSVATLWAALVMTWVIVAAGRDAVAGRRAKRRGAASNA